MAEATASRARRWTANAVAFLVLPWVVIAALEILVRLCGGGYNPEPLQILREDGQKVVATNERFNYQFFRDWQNPVQEDPKFARAKFPLQKPEGTYRIFVYGGSAAMGWYFPQYGLGRVLGQMLQMRFPAAHFEVNVLAWFAMNSHVMLPHALAVEQYQPDLYLIYMGNNERSGPYGARSKLGHSYLSADQMQQRIRWLQMLNHSHLWQVMLAYGGKELGLDRPNLNGVTWGDDIPMDDPRIERIDELYRRNLAAMLDSARRGGAKVLLSTVATNLRMGDTLQAKHSPRLSTEELARYEQTFAMAKGAQASADYSAAVQLFEQCIVLDPQFAEAHFAKGDCLEALGQFEEAREAYQQAKDNSYFYAGITEKMNGIVRETAAANGDVVYFADGQEAVAAASPHGIIGFDHFYDVAHLRFEGSYVLAKTFFETLAPQLPDWITRGQKDVTAPTMEEVRAAMGRTRPVDVEELKSALGKGMDPGPRTQGYFQPLLSQWEEELEGAPEQTPSR